METTVTITVGAIIAGMITLDKTGVLDKILKRNGKSNATKNDVDLLATNHLHELKDILIRIEENLKDMRGDIKEISMSTKENNFILKKL